MVDLHSQAVKVKNTMRFMMVYGTSVLIASIVYWSIGYLIFASAPF